ncbi:quaternary ammonium compound efflux SMR transporter SugE [Anoxybacillus rupiensis]|uniref:Quaternary ammonium compound efflux SMR transporter SugE n=1 Tax=Anoxybacteroides rupiense TaxID=311460 RepID=A0ABD5IUY7_9BACL|nr:MULTISPECIES: quaternary ammonium compound efflux SMR transporter SugE [Anoxybacillus]KXG11177.1 Quaternary ammonium compound-resistance protein SugE [Anoxybacillus sp. P3H1B]MBS2770131.1 quaternary ammonium compound efflux SMR transporter SugE [Anoxybacillus rupiensis]MDE8562495.1 quaternary ammonium compound efflux SMR transporter SugE [Anoxybacillus rupiensis]MED5052124.1 quaternary ammonium compound efflux SMR transporter SugE [Anoxybacillus rupiensis]QHC05847.1 quaternary ammonium comp
MAWIYLIIAGLFEIVWAIALKYTFGFTRMIPSIITIAGMLVSFYFLSLGIKMLPIGTAYAIWTGIGAAGTVIAGILFFNEPVTILRVVFLLLLLVGLIGLKFTSGH